MHAIPHKVVQMHARLHAILDINSSTLDKYLNSFKFLRQYAILHKATSFVYEYGEKVPGYSYVLPCPVTNEYIGQVTGIAFCLYVKSITKVYSICWNVENRSSLS